MNCDLRYEDKMDFEEKRLEKEKLSQTQKINTGAGWQRIKVNLILILLVSAIVLILLSNFPFV